MGLLGPSRKEAPGESGEEAHRRESRARTCDWACREGTESAAHGASKYGAHSVSQESFWHTSTALTAPMPVAAFEKSPSTEVGGALPVSVRTQLEQAPCGYSGSIESKQSGTPPQ